MPCPFCEMGVCINPDHEIVQTYESLPYRIDGQSKPRLLSPEPRLIPIFDISRSPFENISNPPLRKFDEPISSKVDYSNSSVIVRGVSLREYILSRVNDVSEEPEPWTPPASCLPPETIRLTSIILDSVAVFAHISGGRHCVAAALVMAPVGRKGKLQGFLLVTSNQPSERLSINWRAKVNRGAKQALVAKDNVTRFPGIKKLFTVPMVEDVDEYRRLRYIFNNYAQASRGVGDKCSEMRCETLVKLSPTEMDERKKLAIIASGTMLHAEMRILDMLWAGLVEPIEPIIYIGVSMPCCADCTRAVAVFNELMSGSIRVIVGSSHTGTTVNWKPPAFLHSTGFKPAGVNKLEEATSTTIEPL